MPIERSEKHTGIYVRRNFRGGLSNEELKRQVELRRRLVDNPADEEAKAEFNQIKTKTADDMKSVFKEFAVGHNDAKPRFLTFVDDLAKEFAARSEANHQEQMARLEARRKTGKLPPGKPEPTEAERDHQSLLSEGFHLKSLLGSDEAREAAFVGFQLGTISERIAVRPLEPHVVRGLKTLNSSKKAHIKTHGTPEEKQARWIEYRQKLDEYRVRNPSVSFTEAQRRIAKQLGISFNTIRNHTTKK